MSHVLCVSVAGFQEKPVIEKHCLGGDIDCAKISTDAIIAGSSFLTGEKTVVEAGAVVRNSRIHNAVIRNGAVVIDSIITSDGHEHSHKCDAAGRVVVHGCPLPQIAAGANITGSTLINTSVGERSAITDTWACDCTIGSDNIFKDAKIIISATQAHVRVTGPTEVSESLLGHHTTIDRRGYLEGIFSTAFRVLKFDGATGKLKVAEVIDLPHVSRYGVNTINSTNSGKLLPQPGGALKSLGQPAGLWCDTLLSHEQIELAPCCWVVPWTKVVGQSPLPHASDAELVNDDLTTYVMPFAIAGVNGDLTRGLVMPGELSTGIGTKQRKGAWLFTYAPDAVFNMVRRLYHTLEPSRRAVADTIVIKAIQTAIEICKLLAHRNSVDLGVAWASQRPGWPKWLGTTFALLNAHLDSGMWLFKDGQPQGWEKKGGKWTHPAMAKVLAISPDALQNQQSEQQLFEFIDPVPPVSVAMPTGSVQGTAGRPQIDPSAKVDPTAFVGPGCRIGPGTVVAAGAKLWNVATDNSHIGEGATVDRAVLATATVGKGTTIRSCRITDSSIGAGSTAQCATIANSQLADRTTVSCFADVRDCRCDFGTIIGGTFHDTDVDVYLMSMHMAGGCKHLNAVPVNVEVDGKKVAIPAIPMIGGGSLIRGSAGNPVTMECAFIGSNAIIEPGTFIGLGSFILGTIGPDEGILPFTISTGANTLSHQIGGSLINVASTVITHFIGWTYNAAGPAGAKAVAQMCRQGILQGLAAIQSEQARRAGAPAEERFAQYKSLPKYTEDQLAAGIKNYQRALDTGAWDMEFDGKELVFTSANGFWSERTGSAVWKNKE
jgi:UDP-3-O-[3-hydroxymyristoyl] glucosamine N-acyltransferase